MEVLEKCTVSVLKGKCKAAGMAQSGEKPDLVTRLKQHEDAKKGGCLVIMEHNPTFKHLELDSGKG